MAKQCGVYKYVYNGEIIYVGKSDTNILNRIKNHAQETKFAPFLNECEIYYALFKNIAHTSIYETYLINKYRPILNSAMKYDDEIPFDISEPDWIKYDGGGILSEIDEDSKELEAEPLFLSFKEKILNGNFCNFDDKSLSFAFLEFMQVIVQFMKEKNLAFNDFLFLCIVDAYCKQSENGVAEISHGDVAKIFQEKFAHRNTIRVANNLSGAKCIKKFEKKVSKVERNKYKILTPLW